MSCSCPGCIIMQLWSDYFADYRLKFSHRKNYVPRLFIICTLILTGIYYYDTAWPGPVHDLFTVKLIDIIYSISALFCKRI